jgi:hypothetical protein
MLVHLRNAAAWQKCGISLRMEGEIINGRKEYVVTGNAKGSK